MSWKESLLYLIIVATIVVAELEMTNDQRWIRVKKQASQLGKEYRTWQYEEDRRIAAGLLGIPEPSWLGSPSARS